MYTYIYMCVCCVPVLLVSAAVVSDAFCDCWVVRVATTGGGVTKFNLLTSLSLLSSCTCGSTCPLVPSATTLYVVLSVKHVVCTTRRSDPELVSRRKFPRPLATMVRL